jgi:2-polyprenyl-3-methyl-5-hydroxy-6-metoxy-1,4-benzoquinol methylase
MSDAAHWDEHYRTGQTPWETGSPSSELQRVIAQEHVTPCRVVDLGCGSGINALWLAQQGFEVTGIDVSSLALEQARRRAAAANVAIRFEEDDLLALRARYEPFPFFFDRGCYHVVRRTDAAGYVRALQGLTQPGALGLILTGNSRSTHQPGQGPPVVSEEELRSELGAAFDILALREFEFDGTPGPVPFLAWSCLVRRRS